MATIRMLARDRESLVVLALVAWCVLATFLTTLIHVDHVRGTYGVSIGTDTRYCSFELSHDPHGGGIDFWCQTAG
jgi:hypothetical protein